MYRKSQSLGMLFVNSTMLEAKSTYNFNQSGGPGTPTKQLVNFQTNEKPGTIIVQTHSRSLFLVLPKKQAIKYTVAVPRKKLNWSG